MKRLSFLIFLIVSGLFTVSNSLWAQTNVTSKYIDNPNFEARFAGWENSGMTFQTNTSFKRKNGMVYMEKYVDKGNKVGAVSIKQTLVDMEPGTYTLVAGVQNIIQGSDAKQKGAFLIAGNEQVEVVDSADYSVTFTVLEGKAEIGFMTKSCSGNWVSVDNFRLYYNGIVTDSVSLELQRLITEAESVVGDGVHGADLQALIGEAKKMLSALDGFFGPDYQTMAKALSRAILEYRISNATGSIPTVTTEPFIPTGVTIALGRMTVKGTAKERGFCWSTEPNPTVLDNRSTRYFSNNGNIYCMEHMQPATIYYVRAYAITSGWQVAYGDEVKIATLPQGNVSYWYNNGGSEQENWRIASALEECKWMYNHLANIKGFSISCSYGSGTPTADCSYGGSMRVGPNSSYQQTGTILHETNHGVGVGTTYSHWRNNYNLRENGSSGKWLGPRANKIIQFLENDKTAFLTGDDTHMWPYGINGAHEDAYNPENTILYYGNILTTHALHQDGLPCSSSVGFATPAYVFEQVDDQKYYLTSENSGDVNFLTLSSTGALTMAPFDAENSDNYAWYITYDPKTSYYIFQNVGTGKYLSYSTTLRAQAKTSLTNSEKFHLLPGRADVTMGDFTGTGYWITKGEDVAMQANASTAAKASLDFSNTATNQRWLFLTEDQMASYNNAVVGVEMDKLNELLANVQKVVETPHEAKAEEDEVSEIDGTVNGVVETIVAAKEGYKTPGDVATAITDLESALMEFLGKVSASTVDNPFDLSFLLINPGLDGSDGWSTAATNNYSCSEFYEKTFDFNQTTKQKMPAGTYELRVQAFQRPGAADATYTDFVTNGTDKAKAQIYLKTKSQKVKNIWADAQSKSLGGTSSNQGGKYVPNNMLAASKWFAAGFYDNSVMMKVTSTATMKVGIRLTSNVEKDWTCFDNFRLLYYGSHEIEEVTPVEDILNTQPDGFKQYYDLSGRRVSNPTKGLYIVNGKKVYVK